MRNYYKRGINMFLSLLMLFWYCNDALAQVSTYAYSQSNGTYTPITGGAIYGTATTDDERFVDPAAPVGGFTTTGVGLPIGFNFTFNGTVFDVMAINANGWISLGNSSLTPSVNNASTSAYTPLSSTAATTPASLRNRIAGLGRDIQAQAGAEIRLETIGTAPNRVCVVQWTGYKKFGSGGTGDNLNFQIRLNETSNIVQVVFGTMVFNATSNTAHVGLGGSVNTDFNNRSTTTNWNTTTAGGVNTATCTMLNTVTVPVSGFTMSWAVPPATPPTPTQDPAPPTCNLGTNLDLAGPPPTDVTWYWQTSASGTSMANPYAGPYTVFANGTYYARAYNTVTMSWSINSSSVTVTNFPLATAPPAPTADVNPSCAPTGSVLSVTAAPVGYEYYWQGTTLNGTNNSLNASSTYNATASGTYHVAAFETATQCWSNTTSIAVTVDTQIPLNPTVTTNVLNICSGATSAMISANAFSLTNGSLATTQAGGNGCGGGSMFNITTNTNNIVLTSLDVIPNVAGAQTVNVYYKTGTYLGSETTAGAWTLIGGYPINGTAGVAANVDIADLAIPASTTYAIYVNYGAQYTSLATTYTNADLTITTGAGLCSLFGGVNAGRTFNGSVNYQIPVAATAAWFDASSGGNILGTGSPFETIGTSVLPTAVNGSYSFYAASQLGGCYSANRELITVNVSDVNAQLIPVNATCNALNDGSFTLGTVDCGTAPFEYSVNGGTFGPIPTNLTAATYSVVIRDAGMLLSSPIQVVVAEPSAPLSLNATNITYYNASLGWTAQGSESSWTIIYGLAGFDPASGGTVILGATNPYNLTGVLAANTTYDFYVFADCAPGSDTSAAFTFSTDPGFYAYDNQCGPGFTDISSTGDGTLVSDETSFGVTLPFTFNYQGTAINDISIADNGSVILGTLVGNAGFGNAAIGGATQNGLYPFWDDLDEATVYTETVGVAPNRQFIIQWEARPLFLAVAGQDITFQVIIEETTNDVYYIYDDVVFGGSQSFNDNGGSATIGAAGPVSDVQVSFNNTAYLTANSCVHFYSTLCPNPTNLTSLIYADDVLLDWNPGLYGEGNWTLVYGPAGFDPAVAGQAIDTFDLISSDASFGGTLTQLTEYDVYIYSECQADNITSDGLLFNFTTLPYCSIPSALTGATDVDSLELAWNWVQSSSTYPVTSFNISYVMAGNGDAYSGTEVVATGLNFADTVFNTNLLAGGVYEVYVQAACAGTNDTSSYFGPITLIMPLSNDTVCGAENLAVDGSLYTFNNGGATVSVNETNIAPPADGAQVTTGWTNSTLNGTTWFTFVAPASGSVRVNGNAINYNGQIAVYDVIDCADFGTFALLAANDNEINGPSLAPNFTICGLTPGDTYYLMQDGFTAATGNYSITITPIVLEAGTANSVTDICTGTDIDLFTTVTGNNAGGVWSSDIAAVNASIAGSDFTSTGLAYQVFDFQYRVTDGCAYDSIITQVQVFPPSDAGDDGSITACRNEPIDLLSGLTGTADLNGTWYDPSNNAIASSAIVTSNIAGQFNYDYIAGNGVCPNDTANVVVNVLPTCNYLELADELFYGVSLFPNPSEGTVFIASDATQSFDYVVTDANGRLIKEVSNGVKAAQTTEINLNNMETGVYFIKLSNDQAEKVFRVVIR